MAVLIVVGVDETGHRLILAVDVAHSENEADYSDLFHRLSGRGLSGVKLVISDDHKDLKPPFIAVFPVYPCSAVRCISYAIFWCICVSATAACLSPH